MTATRLLPGRLLVLGCCLWSWPSAGADLDLSAKDLASLLAGYQKLVAAETAGRHGEVYRLLPESWRLRMTETEYAEFQSDSPEDTYRLLDFRVTSIERDPGGLASVVIRACGKFRLGDEVLDLELWTDSYLNEGMWSFAGLQFLTGIHAPPAVCTFPQEPDLRGP